MGRAWRGRSAPWALDHRALAIGSHLDSVPDGGAFDGPLGLVCSYLAIDVLRSAGGVPVRPIAVVCWADEEGARFGAACAGSRLLTGALSPGTARALVDDEGVTMAEAMQRAGADPALMGPTLPGWRRCWLLSSSTSSRADVWSTWVRRWG